MKNRLASKIKTFFHKVWHVICLPEMKILPGQLAFFFVLSVVPIITLIGFGANLLNLSLKFAIDFLSKAFSPAVADLIFPDIISSKISLNLIISLFIGFFFASNGADSIIVTSNTIYNIPNKNYFQRRIKAIVMTFLIVILFLFILIVPVFGNTIMHLVKEVNLNPVVTHNLELIFSILGSPISWFIMFMFIKIIYTMAPDKKLSSMSVNYGAIWTTILWGIVTYLYSYYIMHFANYTPIYGGLTNIVVLMLWVYLLAIIFVIGMALNFHEEKLAKEVEN